jgi:hypothetical protein
MFRCPRIGMLIWWICPGVPFNWGLFRQRVTVNMSSFPSLIIYPSSDAFRHGKTGTFDVRARPCRQSRQTCPTVVAPATPSPRSAGRVSPATLRDGATRARALRAGAHNAASRSFFGSPTKAYGNHSGVKVVILKISTLRVVFFKFSTFPYGSAFGDSCLFAQHSGSRLRFTPPPFSVFRW